MFPGDILGYDHAVVHFVIAVDDVVRLRTWKIRCHGVVHLRTETVLVITLPCHGPNSGIPDFTSIRGVHISV